MMDTCVLDLVQDCIFLISSANLLDDTLEDMSPSSVLGHLNEAFNAFDELESLYRRKQLDESLHKVVAILINHKTVRVL